MSEPVFQSAVDGISDGEWLGLLRHVSGDGRRYFTANQLYIVYARNKVQVTRYVARRGVYGLVLIVLGLGAWVYALKADWGVTLVLGIAVTLSGVAMVGTGVVTRRDPAPREPVNRWLAQWTAQREEPKLVQTPTLGQAGLDCVPANVACLLLVEREALVDLLLKNDAHHELSALIVSESGYPPALAAEALRVLTERPDLKVIAVHDATPPGVAMSARLRKSGVFPLAERPVIDAGLFPADVTWIAELAPAIPAGHTHCVPLDSLSFDALVTGIRGVNDGALSLQQALQHALDRTTT